jgi:hypothetical protein
MSRSLTALLSLALLGACSSFSQDQARRLDAGLQVYVSLSPKRWTMDAAELTSYTLLGAELVETTGRLSGRIK